MLLRQQTLSDTDRLEKIQGVLYHISETIHITSDVHELFATIHGIVSTVMPVSGFYAVLHNPAEKALHFPYLSSQHTEAEIRQHGFTEYILKTGEPLLISPRTEQSYMREQLLESGVEQNNMASVVWLGVPLSIDQETIGALVVQNNDPGIQYGEEEKQFLLFISRQLALVIDRERHTQRLQQVHKELEVKVQERTSELMTAYKRLTRKVVAQKGTQTDRAVSPDSKSDIPPSTSKKGDAVSRQRIEEALRKEKQLLMSFTDAVTGILLSSDFRAAIADALEKIGTVADVDRMYIVENHVHHKTKDLLMSLRFEWSRGPIEAQIENPEFQDLPYTPKFTRWYEVLSSNQILRGLVKEFPESERQMLQAQGIISILIVPIIIHGDFWGFIGFDDCYRARQWREEDDAILLAMASSIGGGIARQRAERALRQNNRNFALLNHMHSLFQTRHTEKDSYGILSNVGRLLFPSDSGSVYIMDGDPPLLRKVASWGTFKFEEELSDLERYLALNKAQESLVEASTAEVSRNYLHEASDERFLYAPISTSGEMLGMLHIHFDRWDTIASQDERERLAASKWMLATRIVEHYSLFIVNIRLRERLQKEAIHDPLTGLYNRRHMEATLEREALRTIRKNSSMGIIMFDLDHFKRFNDTYGHDAGDLVLQRVGETIFNSVRGEDIACRYGGEEFLVILPDAQLDNTAERARQIRLRIKEIELVYQGQELHVTSSLGVAAFPYHSPKIEEVLLEADKALYQAKERGRDQVVVAFHERDIIDEVVAELMGH